MCHEAFGTTSSTVYQPLDVDDNQIRILTLHSGSWTAAISCSLRAVSLQEAKHRYHALSYRWGDGSRCAQVTVNGQPFSVTVNLCDALQHLRRNDTDRDLWIDQICINQDDASERMHQMGRLMKAIYVESAEVVIWLGMSDAYTDRLADLLSTGSASLSTKLMGETEREDFIQELCIIYNLILHICQREWWSRVWVVQECGLPVKPPIFQCGNSSFTFTQLEETVEVLKREPKCLVYIGSGDKPATDFLQPLVNMITLRHMLASAAQRTISLIDCLQMTVCRSASNPKDHVYGFLGLVSPAESQALNLGADISTSDLFQRFMTLALRSSAMDNDMPGCYQALRLISFEKKNGSSGPSWVPDLGAQSFSNRGNMVYLLPAKPAKTRFHPQIWFDNNAAVMKMAGFHLDTITHTRFLTSDWQGLPAAIASWQDWVIQQLEPQASLFRRTSGIKDVSGELAAGGGGRAKFRRLFTCNFVSETLCPGYEGGAEIDPDELWELWILLQSKSESAREQLGRKQQSLGAAYVQSVFDNFLERAAAACEGRCWFRTADNYMGITVPSVCAGDVVMLPRGFVMPLLLRPNGAERYRLVGGAYVDGLVADDAVDRLVSERDLTERTWELE